MRQNYTVETGQVWQSSDPRRLSAFRIERSRKTMVVSVESLYPIPGARRDIPREAFKRTGRHGYTRVS